MWINGQLATNHWTDDRDFPGAPGDASQVFTLTRGTDVPIILEFNQGTGGAGAALYWSSTNDTTYGLIPQSNLNKTVTLAAAATGLVASNVTPFSVDLTWQDNSNNEARFQIQRS